MGLYRKENGNLVEKSGNVDYSEINAIKDSLNNLKPKVLWTNPSPTSEFASQTITLSSDDYDILKIYYKRLSTDETLLYQETLKGNGAYISYTTYGTSTNLMSRERTITRNSDTSFTVGNGIQQTNGSSYATKNNVLVPYKVYGYKL